MKHKTREEQLSKIDFLEDVSFDGKTCNFKLEDKLAVLRKWENGPWDIDVCTVKLILLEKDRVGTWNETRKEWYYFNPSLFKKYNIVIKILEKKEK